MTKQTITINAIKELSNEKLENAYKELKADKLPSGKESIVRNLQNELYRENGKVISLVSTKYKIAMEMAERLRKAYL